MDCKEGFVLINCKYQISFWWICSHKKRCRPVTDDDLFFVKFDNPLMIDLFLFYNTRIVVSGHVKNLQLNH